MAIILALAMVGADSLNQKVVEFAQSKLGETVGDGECSALASAALRSAGAKRRTASGWGEPLSSVRDARPGDILQFENAVFVRTRTRDDGAIVTLRYSYPHHTAIVSGVRKRGRRIVFTILHQNAGPEGADEAARRVVQQWTLDLAEMRSGTVNAFRPVAQ